MKLCDFCWLKVEFVFDECLLMKFLLKRKRRGFCFFLNFEENLYNVWFDC